MPLISADPGTTPPPTGTRRFELLMEQPVADGAEFAPGGLCVLRWRRLLAPEVTVYASAAELLEDLGGHLHYLDP